MESRDGWVYRCLFPSLKVCLHCRIFVPSIAIMIPALVLRTTLAASVCAFSSDLYTAGFLDLIVTSKLRGAVTCFEGSIPVAASGMNVKFNYATVVVRRISYNV